MRRLHGRTCTSRMRARVCVCMYVCVCVCARVRAYVFILVVIALKRADNNFNLYQIFEMQACHLYTSISSVNETLLSKLEYFRRNTFYSTMKLFL